MRKRLWPWLIGSLCLSFAALVFSYAALVLTREPLIPSPLNQAMIVSIPLSIAWLLVFVVALLVHGGRGLWLLLGLPSSLLTWLYWVAAFFDWPSR